MKSFILTVVVLACFSGLSRACDYCVQQVQAVYAQPVLVQQAVYAQPVMVRQQAVYSAPIVQRSLAVQSYGARSFAVQSAVVTPGVFQQRVVERRGLFGRVRSRSVQTIIAP